MCIVPEIGVVGVVSDGNGRHGNRDCPGNIGEYITCPPGTAHMGYLIESGLKSIARQQCFSSMIQFELDNVSSLIFTAL